MKDITSIRLAFASRPWGFCQAQDAFYSFWTIPTLSRTECPSFPSFSRRFQTSWARRKWTLSTGLWFTNLSATIWPNSWLSRSNYPWLREPQFLLLRKSLPFDNRFTIVSTLYFEEKASWMSLMKAFLVCSDPAIFWTNEFNYDWIYGSLSWVTIRSFEVSPTC